MKETIDEPNLVLKGMRNDLCEDLCICYYDDKLIKYLQLTGHRDRPTIVRYHPCAENILTSAGYDLSVNIWDVNKKSVALSLGGHLEPVSVNKICTSLRN